MWWSCGEFQGTIGFDHGSRVLTFTREWALTSDWCRDWLAGEIERVWGEPVYLR